MWKVYYVEQFQWHSVNNSWQESIPVGCIPPARPPCISSQRPDVSTGETCTVRSSSAQVEQVSRLGHPMGVTAIRCQYLGVGVFGQTPPCRQTTPPLVGRPPCEHTDASEISITFPCRVGNKGHLTTWKSKSAETLKIFLYILFLVIFKWTVYCLLKWIEISVKKTKH